MCLLKIPVRLWIRSCLARGTERRHKEQLSIVPVKSGKLVKPAEQEQSYRAFSLLPLLLYYWGEHWRWICGKGKNMLGLKLNHPQIKKQKQKQLRASSSAFRLINPGWEAWKMVSGLPIMITSIIHKWYIWVILYLAFAFSNLECPMLIFFIETSQVTGSRNLDYC